MSGGDYETWFETKIDIKLAVVLNRICQAYEHRGRVSRAAFLRRLEATIPNPPDSGSGEAS